MMVQACLNDDPAWRLSETGLQCSGVEAWKRGDGVR